MREAKRSRSGLTHSNREVHKSKKTNASHSFIRNQFLGSFNKRHGKMIGLSILLIALSITGYLFFFAPQSRAVAFISNVQSLWNMGDSIQSGDLSAYNTHNAALYTAVTRCNNGAGITANCIELSPDNTGAIALTKESYDFSSAQAHELEFFSNVRNNFQSVGDRFAMYLTTNGTLPNSISSSPYDPYSDRNVYLILMFTTQTSNGCSPNCTLQGSIYIKLNETDTIINENHGCVCPGEGADYMDATKTGLDTNGLYQQDIILNFTGNSASNNAVSYYSNSGQSTTSGVYPKTPIGANKFFIGFWAQANTFEVIDWATRFAGINNPPGLGFRRGDPSFVTVPQGPPYVDTSGFFGPILRFLISGAVWIWQNIISFMRFLTAFFSPILASIIALFSGVFIAVFNALGGIFGDPTLGNDIGTFFSNLASYFVNIFGLAITIITGIAGPNGLLANAVQIAINFLSGSNNFIGVLVTLATGLAGLIPVLSSFWTLLVSLFNLGIAGADFIIIIMLVLLEFAAITDWIQDDNPIDALVAIPLAFFLFYFLANAPSSINIIALNTSVSTNYNTAWNNIVWFIKLFPIIFFAIFFEWASSLDETARFHKQTTILHNFFSVIKFYRLLTVDVVMGSWWFFDNAYDMITKGITAIKGRWSPVEVAGTG